MTGVRAGSEGTGIRAGSQGSGVTGSSTPGGPAVPTFVAANTWIHAQNTGSGQGSNVAPTVADGDLLMHLAWAAIGDSRVSDADYTKVYDYTDNTGCAISCGRRDALAADSGGRASAHIYSFTTAYKGIGLFAFRGVDLSQAIDNVAFTPYTSQTACVAPAFNTVANNSLVVAFVRVRRSDLPSTVSAGWVTRQAEGVTLGGGASHWMGTCDMPVAGAIPALSVTHFSASSQMLIMEVRSG